MMTNHTHNRIYAEPLAETPPVDNLDVIGSIGQSAQDAVLISDWDDKFNIGTYTSNGDGTWTAKATGLMAAGVVTAINYNGCRYVPVDDVKLDKEDK